LFHLRNCIPNALIWLFYRYNWLIIIILRTDDGLTTYHVCSIPYGSFDKMRLFYRYYLHVIIILWSHDRLTTYHVCSTRYSSFVKMRAYGRISERSLLPFRGRSGSVSVTFRLLALIARLIERIWYILQFFFGIVRPNSTLAITTWFSVNVIRVEVVIVAVLLPCPDKRI
jgi:hypothetical protein